MHICDDNVYKKYVAYAESSGCMLPMLEHDYIVSNPSSSHSTPIHQEMIMRGLLIQEVIGHTKTEEQRNRAKTFGT